MAPSTSSVILTLVLLPVAHYFYCLGSNYFAARKTGLPVVVVPWSPVNPLAFALSQSVHAFMQKLGLGSLTRFAYLGWEAVEKSKPHRACGGAFMIVTPVKNWVSLGDRDAVEKMYAQERKGKFSRPKDGIDILDIFGPNISSAAVGPEWQRMRRYTGNSFNDRTMEVVWRETIKQGNQVAAVWSDAGRAGVNTVSDDMCMLAMNVMLQAGFGKQYDFQAEAQRQAAHARGKTEGMDFRGAMKFILDNLPLIVGIGPKNLPRVSWLRGMVGEAAEACSVFKRYMTDVLEDGKQKQEGTSTSNLLSSLVRASVRDGQLSQEEVFGNMFVFTFGGHDTTMHSLTYTFLMLAKSPGWQQWMREEILQVFGDSDPSTWSYDAFAKLKRVHAVQLETMRMQDPLLGVVKGPVDTSAPWELVLDGGKRTHTIPGDAVVTIPIPSIHDNPTYWGEDSNVWRPDRWIEVDANGEEQIGELAKRFYPWGDGPRVCPGKKFGQVEHTALMSAIFAKNRIGVVSEGKETTAQSYQRVQDILDDSLMVLTVGIRHPEKATIFCERL